MKKIAGYILISGFLLMSLGAIAQPPPPPTDPKEYAPGNAPVGAPVGSGTLLLIGLAGAYAARKIMAAPEK